MAKCPKFEQKGWFSDYYCGYMKKIIRDDVYRRYCRDNYQRCSVYMQNQPSSCYLTTITCNILGKDDNDIVLDKLRNFRDDVLQKDEKYDKILKDYDVIGPVIAEEIRNDNNAYDIASKIYNKNLLNICYKIDNKEYEEAVNKYFGMTYYLMLYYGLTDKYWNIQKNGYGYKEEIDIKKSGHGKKRVLVKESQ